MTNKTLEDFPDGGYCRWNDIKPFMFVSRETFRRLGLEGKAPRPTRMGIRCSYFTNSEIKQWFADPLSYKKEQS